MKCKEGAGLLIDQMVSIIEVIPDSAYAQPLEVFNGSTLGKHFRHIYEFFSCLTEHPGCKEIDYASRKRDALIEIDKTHVSLKFNELKGMLSLLDESQSVSVFADFELPNGERPKVNTTIGRELMYAYDHAVHHLAIVKIGLKSLDSSLPIDEKMGVAASTIQHQYELTHGH